MEIERLRDALKGPGGAVADCLASVLVATAIVALLDSVTTETGLGVVYLLAALFVAIQRSEMAAPDFGSIDGC
jgi:hypothetical protein